MQIKNNSATNPHTINFSDGSAIHLTTTGVPATSVGGVPVGITEEEVDLKISHSDDLVKLCGKEITAGDLAVEYAVTEGNDAVLKLTPATQTVEPANSNTAVTLDIEIEALLSTGERISSYNEDVTITISKSSSGGTASYVTDGNDALTVASSNALVANIHLTKGYAAFSVLVDGTLANADTFTVTTTQKTFRGITLSAVTSITTISL